MPSLPRPPPSGEVAAPLGADGEGHSQYEPSQAHSVRQLSRRGEPLARAESLQLNGRLLSAVNGEDETYTLCQGLHLSGKTSPGRGKMSPPGDKKGNWHFAKRNDGRGSSRKQLQSRGGSLCRYPPTEKTQKPRPWKDPGAGLYAFSTLSLKHSSAGR